jgi:AraC-like DNA-binding protein
MSETIIFQDRGKFFNDVMHYAETNSNDGKELFHSIAPFAMINLARYTLFGTMELNIFEIHPIFDIQIMQYEFPDDLFKIEYCFGGHLLCEDNSREVTFQKNCLHLSQMSDMRGHLSFSKNQSFKSVTFHSENGLIKEILGSAGKKLWEEMLGKGEFGEKKPYVGMLTPLDIAGDFLQIVNCNYPNKVKKLFFESKFLEIVSRMIAYDLLGQEENSWLGAFETAQIKNIPELLMEHLDSPPSIPELARKLSLNATTMKRGFKKIFGEPIYAHHRNMCLERAAMMLLNTNKSIIEIALEVGYSNSGSFGYAFKQRYGVSPSIYRMKCGYIGK